MAEPDTEPAGAAKHYHTTLLASSQHTFPPEADKI